MTLNSTMTRQRAIEIAQQAAGHTRVTRNDDGSYAEHPPPSYYTPPDADGNETFQPHEWVIGAIMNAAHFAVCERFDATAFAEVVDAWIDVPGDGMVPVGYGEPMQRLLNAVGNLVGRDELLKQPEVQRRTAIATAKARVMWLTEQVRLAKGYGLTDEVTRLLGELDTAVANAKAIGVVVLEDPSLKVV